jgi:uncharacterized membrane protein (DUF4010 family)
MEDILLIDTPEFQLTQLEFLIRLLVTTGIGFVLGLERQFSHKTEKGEVFAGVRTITLVGLIGFVSALISVLYHPYIFIAGFASIMVLVAISYWITAHRGEIGGTTEFATLLTFLLGGITLYGFVVVSLALTVIVLVILSLKLKIANIINKITSEELSAFVIFVVLALLILPFLPNQDFGPFNVINPREIGWIIVLTSGIGFFGYVLMKFLGTNIGILLTGIVGGLVSSTVVTWTFAKRSKIAPKLSGKFSVAIFAAASIMVIRVLIWIFIFNKPLLNEMALPLALLFFTALGVVLFIYRSQNHIATNSETIPLGEPINVKDAVFFGVLYTGILLLVSYANSEYGAKGIYVSSIISALTDIDAITISVSKLGVSNINFLTAQNAILLAALSNTIVKIGISLWAGSKELRKFILIGYGIIFLSGIAGFIIINFF